MSQVARKWTGSIAKQSVAQKGSDQPSNIYVYFV